MFPAAWRSLTESARHLCRSSDPWWTEVSLHSSLQRNFTSRCPFTVCVCIKVSSWFVQQTQTTRYVLLSEVIYNSLVMFHRVWTSGAWLYFGTGTTFAHIRGVSASALPLWQSHGRLLRSRDTFEQIIGERGVPWLPCCYWAAHRFHSSIQLSGQLGSAPVLPSFTGHSPASSASDPGHLFQPEPGGVGEEGVQKGFWSRKWVKPSGGDSQLGEFDCPTRCSGGFESQLLVLNVLHVLPLWMTPCRRTSPGRYLRHDSRRVHFLPRDTRKQTFYPGCSGRCGALCIQSFTFFRPCKHVKFSCRSCSTLLQRTCDGNGHLFWYPICFKSKVRGSREGLFL